MHSVFYYLGSWVLDIVSAAMASNTTPNADAAPVFDSNIFNTVGSTIAAFQTFVDMQFMFEALGFLLGWRAVYFAVQVWRKILEIIPMMG